MEQVQIEIEEKFEYVKIIDIKNVVTWRLLHQLDSIVLIKYRQGVYYYRGEDNVINIYNANCCIYTFAVGEVLESKIFFQMLEKMKEAGERLSALLKVETKRDTITI
jgi:hypothetical protein